MLNYEIIIIMIMEKILKYWNEISYLFLEMSPFLVLGFLISGILYVFISKEGIDVDGFGDKLVEQLVDKKILKNISDIFIKNLSSVLHNPHDMQLIKEDISIMLV